MLDVIYISFGFESASDKVLNQDIGKGQLQIHEQKTIDTVKSARLTPLTTFMIGNPHENINDLMETVTFWIQNDIEVESVHLYSICWKSIIL